MICPCSPKRIHSSIQPSILIFTLNICHIIYIPTWNFQGYLPSLRIDCSKSYGPYGECKFDARPRRVSDLKASSDPNHFKNKCRKEADPTYCMSHTLNDEFVRSFKIDWRFKFRIVLCWIPLFPTLISKIKMLGSELTLNWIPEWNLLV